MKLYVNSVADTLSFPARIVAHATKQELKVLVADAESKKLNFTGVYPFLVTPQGNIAEPIAIAKFLAHGSNLFGANAEQRGKVDQWIYWAMSDRNMPQAVDIIHGKKEVSKDEFQKINTEIKNSAKTLNGFLGKDRQFLVSNEVTLADIFVACHYIVAQQTMLDAGYRKAMGNYGAWFERVIAHPSFVGVCGHIKSCTKSIQPQFKAEEKKEAPKKQQAAAKPKAADEDDDAPKKAPKSALESLPPTNFDLFNFKTFFVNEPDRYGKGVDELKAQFDKEGWSVWFLHYEMYGDEGQKLYHTENLADGFIQRFDSFRKWSFARMCILGTEQKQEIMGVFMWRSLGVPQECLDHPQFEYYHKRQLDIFGNAEDDKCIRDFWGSSEGKTIQGMEVLSAKWHK